MVVDIGSVTAVLWTLALSGRPNCYRIFRRNSKARDFPNLHLNLVSPTHSRQPKKHTVRKTELRIISEKYYLWYRFLWTDEKTPVVWCSLGDGESVTNADESLALKKLRSSCMVIRVDDLDIHQVSVNTHIYTHTQSHSHGFHFKIALVK